MNDSRLLACRGGKPRFVEPFVLRHQWGNTAKQLLTGIISDGRIAHFYGGPLGRRFEESFARKQGAAHGVAVNSGTSALHLCYRLCGVGPGDEVIVPAHAYVSALSAILMLDAIPILCDVDPATYGLDTEALKHCISERTKVIVAVHLYGRPCRVDNVVDEAGRIGAKVVEDCGQGHGALLKGKPLGALADMSAWSFFEPKHVCTGEGGMCLFPDERLAARARSLVYKGKGLGWWDYFEMGYSYMFTEPQAAFGLESLEKYDEQVQLRRAIEKVYQEELSGAPGLEIPCLSQDLKTGAFKTPFRVASDYKDRVERFLTACQAENVPIQKGYPALHRIRWIKDHLHRAWHLKENSDVIADYSESSLPVASDLCGRTLCLATGPGLSLDIAREIAITVKEVALHIFK